MENHQCPFLEEVREVVSLAVRGKICFKVTKPTKSYFDSEMTNKLFILHALDKDKSLFSDKLSFIVCNIFPLFTQLLKVFNEKLVINEVYLFVRCH